MSFKMSKILGWDSEKIEKKKKTEQFKVSLADECY